MQDDNYTDPLLYRDPEETGVQVFAIPDRALNVEAATLSALADSDQEGLQQYQRHTLTPREEQPMALLTEFEKRKRSYDDFVRSGLTEVLVDTTIPSEVRINTLENAHHTQYAPEDPAAILGTLSALSPSEGETDQGAKVRDVLAESFTQAHKYLDEKQQIINNAVNRHENGFEAAADMLGLLVTPGQDATAGIQLASKLGKSMLRGAVLPGSLMQDLNKEFLALPQAERLVFMRSLAEVVAKSSSLFTNQNLLRYQALMQDMTDEQGFSDGQEAWVNVLNLLDFVGVGVAIRGATKAAGTAARNLASRQAQANKAFSQFDRAGRDIPMDREPVGVEPIPGVNGDAAIQTSPQVPALADEIVKVEAELTEAKKALGSKLSQDKVEELRSSLALIENEKPRLGSRATPKEVAEFARSATAREKRVEELRTQLQQHESAVAAEERVASLEDQLSTLKANDYQVDAVKSPIQSAIDRAYTNSILAPTHPRAPANILSQTNFAKGRAAYAQTLMDESGQFAEAMYGVTRQEALISQVAPQATDATHRVVRKMDDPEAGYRKLASAGLDKLVNNVRDGLRYTKAELASGRAAVVRDYTDTTQLVINDAMTSIRYDGDRVIFSGMYTNGQGGWTSAREAIEQAKYALRKRGMTDDNITVMKLEGDEFKPTTLDDAGEGVFAIRIDVEDYVKDKDITKWDEFDVKRNIFDRFQGRGKHTGGSIQQHLVEPNSMFRKELTGSFSVAEDKSALITEALIRKFESFGKGYRKLDKAMRQRVEDYIIKANIEELPFDAVALRANFPQEVVDMLRDWRDAWDDMFLLMNADVIKSLRFEGYQLFKNQNIEAVVKEATQGYKGEKIYDPASDSSKVLSDQELKDIRAKGGYIGRFRSPMSLNGQNVEFMIVRDTPTEYARGLVDTDRILNYRHGYYQVSYKAPKFIESTVVDSSGKKTVKVVGVAGSYKEAKEMVERMQIADPSSTYSFRGDEKSISRDRDVYWELNSSFGLLAQRHRGKLLEDSAGIAYGNVANIIENPADSAIRASMSLGGRIAMRDVITTAKTRWMKQNEHLVKDGFPKEFPASLDDIFKKGEYTTKELADARSTWNYINTMENGYINSMDAGLKMAFNLLADTAGLKGWDTVEKLARATGDVNFTAKAKGAAFVSYLASNPLRMILVNGMQGARILAYSHIHTPKVIDLVIKWSHGGASDFRDFYSSTGLSQSLNRSNLIRGTLLDAAQRESAMGSAYGKGVQALRRVGFDIGETINNVISAAAVFEEYKRLGKDVSDLRVRAEMHAKMRAITRNMNRAGDMPYNHNYLALIFTYMQVPHKFALQWADRTLTPAERTRLIVGDLSLWGLPAGIGTYIANQEGIGDDPILKQMAEEGLMAMFLNWSFSQASGTNTRIDFSSMAPWDLTGFYDMAMKLVEDESMAALITESPAGRILGLNAESRLGFALKTTARMFKTLGDDDLTKTTVVDAVDAWLRLSSGWNNMQEAILMYQLGKATDRQGRATDDEVTLPEIAAKAFGFGTKDTKEYYETIIGSTKTIEKAREFGKARVKETMLMIRHLSDGDLNGAQAIALYTQAMLDPSNFPDRTTYQAALSSAMVEFKNPANNVMQQKLFKTLGLPSTYEDLARLTRGSSLTPEQKELFTNFLMTHSEEWKKLEENNKE